jgi:hypothetical protein
MSKSLPDCPTALMKVLGQDSVPLEVIALDSPGAVAVAVPTMGHLVYNPANPGQAILTQGPGTEHTRPVLHEADGSVTCELLHKADRLCVWIIPQSSST